MTAISQLQLSYNPEEDRILLRVNTDTRDEFRFWLTRRFSQMLIQALTAHRSADPDISTQITPEARDAVQSFKQEAANSQGNFGEEFRSDNRFPLGEAPVLGFKLSYKIDADKLKLTIAAKDGPGINLVLDPQLNFNISKLLRTAGEQAKWGLEWGQPEAELAEPRVIN